MYIEKINIDGFWYGYKVNSNGVIIREPLTIEKVEKDIAELHAQLAVSDKILNQLAEEGIKQK